MGRKTSPEPSLKRQNVEICKIEGLRAFERAAAMGVANV